MVWAEHSPVLNIYRDVVDGVTEFKSGRTGCGNGFCSAFPPVFA